MVTVSACVVGRRNGRVEPAILATLMRRVVDLQRILMPVTIPSVYSKPHVNVRQAPWIAHASPCIHKDTAETIDLPETVEPVEARRCRGPLLVAEHRMDASSMRTQIRLLWLD